MVKVYIETYGCELNRGDTAIMKTILEKNNIELVDSPHEADVLIINTCIVRYDTEVRMIKRIRELAKMGKKLIVAGCMAKALPFTVRKIAPKAVLLTPQAVEQVMKALMVPEGTIISSEYKEFNTLPIIVEGPKVTLPIAEGCLDECAFCIVKRARPILRSVPMERVVDALKNLVKQGAREIALTAQDLGVYGVDLYGRYALIDLLRKILALDLDFKLRIGQINPRHLINYLDEFVEILQDPRVYKHVHIPVQSGNNNVLKTMDRGHDVEIFIEIVKTLKNKIEGVHIATDIIVGHPGEDEIAFLDSVELLLKLEIDRVHIARFSPRPLTKAASLPQVPDPVKKIRSTYIERVYEVIGLALNREYIGSYGEALISEPGLEEGTLVARIFNYRPVVVKGDEEMLGKKVIVLIKDATFFDLRGEIIKIIE